MRKEWTDVMLAKRQATEKVIVRAAVRGFLRAGYKLSVSWERGWDKDEMLKGSRNEAEIMEAAGAGDECHLFVHEMDAEPIVDGRMNARGWVFLVFGNDGWDVIADYTTNLEAALKHANDLADAIDNGAPPICGPRDNDHENTHAEPGKGLVCDDCGHVVKG